MEQKASDVILSMLIKQLNKKPDEVKLNMRIKEDLGADSLDIVTMLMNLEDDYGISIPDDDASELKTVAALVAYLEKKQKK